MYAVVVSGVSTICGLLFAAWWDPHHPSPSWFLATIVLDVVLGSAGGIGLRKWDKHRQSR